MTILGNILLALVMIAGYGGYAAYERAHADSADLFTLIRGDLAAVRDGTANDPLAYGAPRSVPHGMTQQEYAQYVAQVNADATAYRASHPAVAEPTPSVVAPVSAAPTAKKPAAVATAPKPTATVVAQTHTVTTAQTDNPTVAAVSGTNTLQPQPTPTPAPAPTPQPVVRPQPATPAGRYRDGTYTGSSVDVFYGFVQVQATVSGGNLTDVTFLSYPSDRRQSIQINQYAMPRLVQQAMSAQSANVSGVSGATDTSYGFQQSLAAALSQA